MTGEMVIEARGLTKRFGKVVAIDDVDLNVPRGSAFGLLGPAGAGKSTLVRLLAGLTRPSGGTLSVSGAPGGSLASRRELGVLLQDAQPYGWMTAREALAFAGGLARVPAAELPAQIAQMAETFAIAELLDRRIADLPAPIRGRVAIAQALMGSPELVVLDEPFHWLDPEGRDEVLGVLRGLRGSTTLVLAAHRPADIEALCDRAAVLESGRIIRTSVVERPKPRKPAARPAEAPSPRSSFPAALLAWLRELLREVIGR